MDPVAWTAGERPVVGVLEGTGDDADEGNDPGSRDAGAKSSRVADAISTLVADRDGSCVTGRPAGLADVLAADPDFLVAVGDEALSALVRADVDRPVLLVDVDPAVAAASRETVRRAVGAVLDGDAVERRRPLLSVTADGRADVADRALFDVTLVTDEPAHISEYAVSSRGERVARFRADGVVVATAAGTLGYAGTVSAPELSPAVDAVAVSPIAPFVTHANRWVLPDDDLSVSVERDEGDVSLSADGRTLATIGPETGVDLAADGSLSTLIVPEADGT